MNDMPDFKPSNTNECIKRVLAARKRTHFSRADWDFENVSWTLDGAIFHTAAPSLSGTDFGLALVKDATTGALSDGRMVAWRRSNVGSALGFFYFRNQDADGSSSRTNTYGVEIRDDEIMFTKHVGGAPTTIDTHAFTWVWALNTWYKIRVTWWTSVDRIYVRVERWTGTEWATLGGAADTDFEDVNDLWKDAAVNRCGVYYGNVYWIDDFEIWG